MKTKTPSLKSLNWIRFLMFATLFSTIFLINMSYAKNAYPLFSPEGIGFYVGYLYGAPEHLLYLILSAWLWIKAYKHFKLSETKFSINWFNFYNPNKINQETAKQNIDNALIAGGLITFGFFLLTPPSYLDVIFWVFLLVWLHKKKLWAAIGVLVLFLISVLLKLSNPSGISIQGLILVMVFLHFFVSAITGVIRISKSSAK